MAKNFVAIFHPLQTQILFLKFPTSLMPASDIQQMSVFP